jgi:F0F1-type ATP synthase membrane subunit b/b'
MAIQLIPSATNDIRDSNGLLVNPVGAQFDRNTGKKITSQPAPYDFNAMMKDPEYGQHVGYITQQAKTNNWQMQTPEQKASEMWNSPENLAKSVGQRQDLINKYFQEQTDSANKEAQSDTEFGMKDYQNTINQLNQGLTDSTRELSNSSASKGAFGSTAYQENQKSLANQYNNKFTSAYDTASRNADTQGMKDQKQLGMSFATPTYNKYNTQGTTGQSYKYNPFQQRSGSLEENRKVNLTSL